MTIQSMGIAPSEMCGLLTRLGELWAQASERPRVANSVKAAWDDLIKAWIKSDLPLVVRKGGGVRGEELQHTTGRRLIVSDNSPAQWAFTRAFEGEVYDVDRIRDLLNHDQIPFTFATKNSEKHRMKYTRTLTGRDNVNKRGWKLCHIEGVGLSTKTPLEMVNLEDLCAHFRRLLAPSNQFLVPLRWSGLGEVPEFVAAMRNAYCEQT
jgi:hypothetical protein